jgi:hypothetical protein
MADTYGSLPFPIAAPGDGETASDHALDVLLAYLKAFLNHYGATAWQSIYKANKDPGNLPVVGTFAHDPEYDNFNERDLPAIFLFRNGGQVAEDIAEDIRTTHSSLTMWWVFPADKAQDRRARQRPFLNGIAKLVDQAFRKERDPAYVIVGDTEPTAAIEGSVVLVHAGIERLFVGAPQIGEVRIPKGNDVGMYPRVQIILDIDEWRTIDKTLFPALEAVDVDFQLTDGSVFEQATYT